MSRNLDLRFSVLGPVRAHRDGIEVHIGSPQQRLVLAVLLLAGGRVVGHGQLLDAVWGADPPRTALSTLRTYISRLRAALGADVIVSVGNGYALPAGTCDADRMEELTRAGRHGEALALWQGEPLAGLDGAYAQAQQAHLAERRLVLLERRIENDIEDSRHAEVVAELTLLCAAHPTRERLAGFLMRALYRSGRQAEALGVFTDLRELLAEELGIDPSPELAELYQQILKADPDLGVKTKKWPAATPVPRQLPADTTDFTGREPNIGQVTRALRAADASALVIAAVAGAGGMGKTTLAVHVAHRIAADYPDGQLFVDLQGAGPRPLPPDAVLGAFLRAFGVDVVSESLSERAALYRSALADRRVLVVLDNATDVAQVRPLLPGAAGCAVLVTSRARLTGLSGARHLHLEAMRPDEATALLIKVVGEARVAAEREAAGDLVRACGYLPLAIRVVASRLAARPGWSLARMRDRVADERRRLAELRVDDLAVEATFTLGYDQLDAAHAAAFRLLAVPNAPDLSSSLAAAVLDMDEADAEELCEALVNVSMMDSPAPGRYRHHDLLKIFARSRLDEEDGEQVRREVLERLLGCHLAGIGAIFAMLYPGDPLADAASSGSCPSFPDLDAALEWGQAEEQGALSCLQQVAETPGGRLYDAVWLLDMMSQVFDFESDTTGYERAAQSLISAAVERGDLATEVYARHKHAEILYGRKASEAALDEVRTIRELDPAGVFSVNQAYAVNVSAMVAHDERSWDEAITRYNEVIRIWRAHDRSAYEALALGNLALVLGEAGRGEAAVPVAELALGITTELSGGRPNPQVVYQLAVALSAAGRHEEALARFEEGRAEFRRIKQFTWEGMTLRRMAETCFAIGRPERAVDHAEEALTILAEVDQMWARGKVLTVLGRALGQLGQRDRARACLAEAVAMLGRPELPDTDDVRALLG
ncbi:tetratricopeptide repeat protein [Nonomuraea turkmeniaca]|uniref:Tetratricopeptide repeat protein n=1 Tax=Nonomuraea turkmeniaca TaxID=103838 RepID=A0A5S4FY10_9ACTN|nr:AfsR/SARP family transcriptional regulator [Nonomuraea turkmeniaca]TMR25675.1 tetratricopeptide repeat protein [Nonomuraea turkmeniaca]